MDNELVHTASKAIRRIFNDDTVDKETTWDRLTEVAEEIEMLLDTLK